MAELQGRDNILAQISEATRPLHIQLLEAQLKRYDAGVDPTAEKCSISRLSSDHFWYTYQEWYDVFSVKKDSDLGRQYEQLNGDDVKKRFLREHATRIWELGMDAALDPSHPLH